MKKNIIREILNYKTTRKLSGGRYYLKQLTLSFKYVILKKVFFELWRKKMATGTVIALLVIFFGSVAVSITAAGAWASLKYGKRTDGWSDIIAIICTVTMAVATLAALYKLQKVYYLPEIGGIYTGLVLWYTLCFFFGQRWIVQFTRKNWTNTGRKLT